MLEFGEALRRALAAQARNATLSVGLCQNADAMRVAHALMDAMPIMIALFDKDLRYIYVNQRYLEIAGPQHLDWRGAYIPDFLPAMVVKRIMPQLIRVLRGERVSYHLDLPPQDGMMRTVLVNYEPIATENDSTIYLMTGQDASELKQAERRLFAAQKLETLGQLTGGIAHDFNNLIGIVVGNLSLMRLQTEDPQLLDRLEKCRQAADRCSKMTSQLLSFARRQPMKPRILTVGKQLETMRDLIRITVPSNIEIAILDRSRNAELMLDQTQLESALMNLIINARDSMQGGGRITIEASVGQFDGVRWAPQADVAGRREKPPGFVLIEVTDTGEGMPPDIMARVFEPFVTTKKEGAGSGMGLAMVYGFVTQSGGFVDLSSDVGKGTTVRMFLPLANADDAQAEAPASEVVVACRHHNILVVEDDPELASIMCEMLAAMGHAARHCDSAPDALACLSNAPEIDVVLTDIMLRGTTSGLDLREQIRTQYPKIRVICASGYQDQNARRSFASQPDIEFIGKPFDFNELRVKLSEQSSPGA